MFSLPDSGSKQLDPTFRPSVKVLTFGCVLVQSSKTRLLNRTEDTGQCNLDSTESEHCRSKHYPGNWCPPQNV